MARLHPIYGFDLDAVPGVRCLTCKRNIGNEPYELNTTLARFGQMFFHHRACPMGIAAVYARVSSKGQDLRSQEADLRRWMKGQEGKVAYYSDKASGTTMERPDWERLWKDVEAGLVSKIVVWRLDRLGRTARGLTALFEELRQRSIDLISLREGIDLGTPAGRMMATVIASVAQYETEVRSERQTAGIKAAQAAGKKFGRPKGTGKPIKATAEVAELVKRLKGEGQAVASIARVTSLSRDTVYAILKG